MGIVFDDQISADEILQDSHRSINVKGFDVDFLNVFQTDVEEVNSEHDIDDIDLSLMESDESVKEKVESFVPTIIKMREGEHRNHVLRLSSKSRNLIKDKLVDLTTFFIKQKLSLMRYVRPVNSKLINEVTKCISQIDCETMYFNLDLKNYKAPANILLKMVKDELKNSSILRFGYQKTSPDEDTFFVISTKHFKSFEAEKVKDKRDYRPANASKYL